MKTAPLVCFVCGSKGANCLLYIKPRSKGSYFSFLENHDPPKGAKLPNGEGVVKACLVCYAFLNQQWDSFERTKTPMVKRLYWLKRVDNRSFTGAELNVQGEYVAQIMGVQYNSGISGNVSPFEYGSHTGIACGIKNPVPSPVNNSDFSPLLDNQDKKQTEVSEVLDLSVSPKKPKINSRKFQKGEEINGPAVVKPSCTSASAGSRNNKSGSIVCYVCWKHCPISLARFIYAVDHSDNEPYFPFILELPEPPGAMTLTKNGVTQVCSECRKTLSRQWRFFDSQKIPETGRVYKIKDSPVAFDRLMKEDRNGLDDDLTDGKSSGAVCYLCGEWTLNGRMQKLKSREIEPGDSRRDAVLPFLEKLKCPLGSRLMTSQGIVFVCVPCYDHVQFQWKQFESSNLPPDKRKYILRPFLNGRTMTATPDGSSNIDNGISSETLVDRKVDSRVTPMFDDRALTISKDDSHSESSMTLTPPRVQERLHFDACIADEYSKALPDLPTYDFHSSFKMDCNKNMMTKRDHVAVEGRSSPVAGQVSKNDGQIQLTDAGQLLLKSLPGSCFLCGYKLKKCREDGKNAFAVYDRPTKSGCTRSREDDRAAAGSTEPFFPFLSTLKPSAGADKVATDGRVSVCNLCYVNLLAQWFIFEKSRDIEEQNRWLRKYKYRLFVCILCKKNVERQDVQIVFADDGLQKLPGVVSVEGKECTLVCASCLVHLKSTEMQNGKAFHRPRDFVDVHGRGSVADQNDVTRRPS